MSKSIIAFAPFSLVVICIMAVSNYAPAQSPAATPNAQWRMLEVDPDGHQPMSLTETRFDEPSKEEKADRSGVVAKEPADDLTERQSVDAFNSMEDGQPGPPGELELLFDFGWQTKSGEHDPFSLLGEIQYTPDGNDFFRNMQLILGVPVEMGLGGVEGNADIHFGWQQRWVKEDGWMPTFSTLAEVRLPSGYHSSGVDGTITGILAKDLGPGTLYLNGFAKTANGDNIDDLRHFQWGFRTGYKWRISDALALIGDYLNQSSEENGHANVNALEFSGAYKINEHVTVGPGILIGLDHNDETPNFGAGVRLQISF